MPNFWLAGWQNWLTLSLCYLAGLPLILWGQNDRMTNGFADTEDERPEGRKSQKVDCFFLFFFKQSGHNPFSLIKKWLLVLLICHGWNIQVPKINSTWLPTWWRIFLYNDWSVVTYSLVHCVKETVTYPKGSVEKPSPEEGPKDAPQDSVSIRGTSWGESFFTLPWEFVTVAQTVQIMRRSSPRGRQFPTSTCP